MHSRVTTLAAVVMAFALGGCSKLFPEPVSGPQNIAVITYDPSSQKYALAAEQISTLQDLRTLQGTPADISGGGTITANYTSLVAAKPNTPDSVKAAVVTKEGDPVDFNSFKVGDVLYPADSDSLNMATAYYQVEQAYLYFLQFGIKPPTSIPIYYFPTLSVTAGGPLSVTDLGFSDPWLGVLVVPSFTGGSWMPPALQPGVVAYEYAQAVFALQVFGAQGPSWLDINAVASPAKYAQTINIVRSLNAGMADFLAAAITQDPTWIRSSAGAVNTGRQLNPAMPRCLTTDISAQVSKAPRAMYDPHALGSVLAAIFYDPSTRADLLTTYPKSVVAAMTAFGKQLNANRDSFQASPLTLEQMVNDIMPAIDPNASSRVCALLIDRLALDTNALNVCSNAGSVGTGMGNSCAP